MPFIRRIIQCLGLCVLIPGAAGAAPVDGAVHGSVAIEDKVIPLPPGDWQITGRSLSHNKVVSLSLLRLHGNAADAAVLIQTNQIATSVKWGQPDACKRVDLYYARVRYVTEHDGSCAYAAYVDATPSADTPTDPAWRSTLQQATQSSWSVPTTWVVSAFCLSDRADGLEVRYYFAPDRAPPPAYLSASGANALTAWTRAAWGPVSRGFRNRRGEATPAALPDFRPGDVSLAASIPPSRPTTDGESVGLGTIGLKTLTFRIVGTTADFTTNLIFVGDAALAASMSVVGTIVGPIIFFLHELAWSYAQEPAIRALNLPGIGVEGPDPAKPQSSRGSIL